MSYQDDYLESSSKEERKKDTEKVDEIHANSRTISRRNFIVLYAYYPYCPHHECKIELGYREPWGLLSQRNCLVMPSISHYFVNRNLLESISGFK